MFFLTFYFNFRVRNWATKLGGELWHFGDLVTRQNRVRDVSNQFTNSL